jgi:putative serine protease PepD
VITELGDADIADSSALSPALARHQPGQQVQVTYLRSGTSHTANVTLGTL